MSLPGLQCYQSDSGSDTDSDAALNNVDMQDYTQHLRPLASESLLKNLAVVAAPAVTSTVSTC